MSQKKIKNLRSPWGATGQFPDGKLSADDEGELRFGVAADRERRQVIVDFGKPVTWFSMPPDTARDLAILLMRIAGSVDGQITRLTIGGMPSHVHEETKGTGDEL